MKRPRRTRRAPRIATIVLGVGISFVAACQTLHSSKAPSSALLRTDSSEIGVLFRRIGYVAKIGFVYQNTTKKAVSKAGCGFPPWPAVEKKVNGRWVLAYAPGYLACLSKPDFALLPGATFHGVISFIAYEPGHNIEPTLLVDSIDGIYRLRWDFVEGDDASAEGARQVEAVSNEFRMILSSAAPQGPPSQADHSTGLPTGESSETRLFGILTPMLLADLASGVVNPTVHGPDARAWRVRARAVDTAAATIFLKRILMALDARLPTATDTLVENLEVEPVTIAGDSAVMAVDRGRLWCERGQPLGVGMIYKYYFRRVNAEWKFVRRVGDTFYDPPPVSPEQLKGDACARAFSR